MPRPNIIVFFTDDQRWDTIEALGNPQVKTPNIDSLVERGTAFTHAHIPGGTVGAVCMPSRAMLHSGRSLFHLDGAGASIPADHVTMGQHFRSQGYRTFGTGKWHNGPESYARSFTDGGEIFFGGMADHWNVPACRFDPTGKYDVACPEIKNPSRDNVVNYRRCDHVPAGKHSSELFCDAAVDFLDRQSGDDPFFIYVSFMAPHDPRSMPKRFLDMYDPDEIELPENYLPQHPFDNGELLIRDELLESHPRTEDAVRRHLAEYYAMITHLDDEMGRVMRKVDAMGQTDNTIFVFAGDNGLALGQHGLMGKQSNYEHSVRVPLVFAGPGIPTGQRREAFAYIMDIFPTVSELAGVDIPSSVEGQSLVPALKNPDELVRDTLFFAYADIHRAVKDRRYKLIEYVVSGTHVETQLFDLEEDPLEMHTLADDGGHAEVLAGLRKELFRWRDEWDDRDSVWGKTFWDGYEGKTSPPGKPFDQNTPIAVLAADSAAAALLRDRIPWLMKDPRITMSGSTSLRSLSFWAPDVVPRAMLPELDGALRNLGA
jgi:arylsulfatase A-like enzyme